MVELRLPKPSARVRFPSPAPINGKCLCFIAAAFYTYVRKKTIKILFANIDYFTKQSNLIITTEVRKIND